MIATGGYAAPAVAADLGSLKDTPPAYVSNPQSPWTFKFATYAWLPWITGDLAVKGRPFDIDVSPSQVLGHLNWSTLPAWMSYFEARNGRLGLFNDIVYANLTDSRGFARARQGQSGSLSLAGGVEADYRQAIVELGAAYQLWANGAAVGAGAMAFDILGGARYWNQKTSVSADFNSTLAIAGAGGIADLERSGSRVIARSGTVDWVDPFIGARVRYAFAPGQQLMMRGDIGGFGAGSDFSWQLLGTWEWQILQRGGHIIDAYLGYRALSVDYTQGSGRSEYKYDAVQHGPVVGATLRF